MQRSFIEYEKIIKSIEPQYFKDNEDLRLVFLNILDDWREDREKLINMLKIAIDTIEEMQNLPSVNQMMRAKNILKEAKLEGSNEL